MSELLIQSRLGEGVPLANGTNGQVLSIAGGVPAWATVLQATNPLSAAGDIIYGGVSGALTALTKGTTSQLLIGGTVPSWGAVALTSMVSGILPVANGGTGVANGTNNKITFTGNYSLGLTVTGNTALTLPTSGTLATLAGTEVLAGKTLTTPILGVATGTSLALNGATLGTNKLAVTGTSALEITTATSLAIGGATIGTNALAVTGTVAVSGIMTLPTVTHTGVAIGSLPTPVAGMVASVTDATAPSVGATVAAGGAVKCLVWYNGAAWKVAAV